MQSPTAHELKLFSPLSDAPPHDALHDIPKLIMREETDTPPGSFALVPVCFAMEQSWHQVYRNFEEDPYLGGKTKCIKGTHTGDLVGDSAVVIFEYPPDGIINTIIKLMSSPGYTAKNVLNVQPVDQPGSSVNLTISYQDCHSCKVIRHSYINEGKGCSLWVTGAGLGQPHTCCDYIFELLCGLHPAYKIYDHSCQ
ncbi:uncharacterized protein LOC125944217 [Dermacentor silvarum]|uniref:uncharacterized protein LOC125944217 n=1 Tax=Dermacentor silvarum TaxID=543639 RepID=UPI0021010EA7|nr:uncharacterized protein LOC125944217 [Dermacentor silvarum]